MTTRVFHAPADPAGFEPPLDIRLDPEESHYLTRVRRLRVGDAVEVNDLGGGLWRGRVVAPDTKAAQISIEARVQLPPPPPPTQLLLGLPDPKTVLELLPGLCELGVSDIVFVRCARSQSDGPGSARTHKVLRAALRQCGRPSPPEISGPFDVASALALRPTWPGVVASAPRRLTASPAADTPTALAPPSTGLRLAVGPEGGFTPQELAAFEAAQFTPVSLGPWILRTQTAALALVAASVRSRVAT